MALEKRQDAKYYHEVKAKVAARKTSWIILKDDQKRSGMCTKRKSERELGVGRGAFERSEALQGNNEDQKKKEGLGKEPKLRLKIRKAKSYFY